MPLVVGLGRWDESRCPHAAREARSEKDEALARLRERYARGELTHGEFETRVERLLETESVAEAETHVTSRRDDAADTGAVQRERRRN
jgi:phage shock protein A